MGGGREERKAKSVGGGEEALSYPGGSVSQCSYILGGWFSAAQEVGNAYCWALTPGGKEPRLELCNGKESPPANKKAQSSAKTRKRRQPLRHRKLRGEESLWHRERGRELSECSRRKRAKATALGLPLFLCSPEISPSFSPSPVTSQISQLHVPRQLNPFLATKKQENSKTARFRLMAPNCGPKIGSKTFTSRAGFKFCHWGRFSRLWPIFLSKARAGDIMVALWVVVVGGWWCRGCCPSLINPRSACPTQTLMVTASVLVIKHQLITTFHSAS